MSVVSADILKRIHRIEIRTSRLVNELFGGQYLSTFKGRGMSFSDIREYIPGDDVRNIHWNVTARLGTPFVKRFEEERELTIIMVVDVSASLHFGTRSKLKSEMAAELVSLLAFSSLKNNDKVGLLLFSDQIEGYIPPRKSKSHVLRLIRDVLGQEPRGKGTDLAGALHYLNRVQKKRAIVFVISDFIAPGYEQALSITQKHHDTVALVLEDPMEKTWPAVGRVLLEDAETGKLRLSKPGRRLFQTQYGSAMASQARARDQIFTRYNIDHVIFQTNEDYVRPMISFFQKRAQRYRR